MIQHSPSWKPHHVKLERSFTSNRGSQLKSTQMEVLCEYQQRYSQTERGSCHIWAFEYFHSYTFRVPFTAYTDHKPLMAMLNNPRSQLSARFERWFMTAQPYGITVQYRSGADNSADHLSPSCQTVYRRQRAKDRRKIYSLRCHLINSESNGGWGSRRRNCERGYTHGCHHCHDHQWVVQRRRYVRFKDISNRV